MEGEVVGDETKSPPVEDKDCKVIAGSLASSSKQGPESQDEGFGQSLHTQEVHSAGWVGDVHWSSQEHSPASTMLWNTYTFIKHKYTDAATINKKFKKKKLS